MLIGLVKPLALPRLPPKTDRSTPQTLYRWTGTWVLALLFIARIYFAGAYYIVTYALGIYLLSAYKLGPYRSQAGD
jgi:hypothetical protein